MGREVGGGDAEVARGGKEAINRRHNIQGGKSRDVYS